MTYPVILADPPWEYNQTGVQGNASGHYSTMPTAALCSMDVPAADNAALFLWATWPLLPSAIEVAHAWGFEYKTLAWVWVKLNRNSMGLFMGTEFYTRSNSEPCLLCLRGKPVLPTARDVMALIMSPIQQHSRKPDDQYRKIERLYPNGPYLEMFARRKREGWDAWGNEVESDLNIGVTAS